MGNAIAVRGAGIWGGWDDLASYGQDIIIIIMQLIKAEQEKWVSAACSSLLCLKDFSSIFFISLLNIIIIHYLSLSSLSYILLVIIRV